MEPTPISLPWLDIAKLALSTGVVSVVITQGTTWIRDWRKEAKATRREATYLALRIAVTLERFAIDCAMFISDNTAHEDTWGNLGRLHSQLPELSPYPDDVDWKSIDAHLASRALSLRNELPISNEQISACLTIDPDFGVRVCNEQTGLRGFRAWQLATEMRQHYELPAFDPRETSWDMVKHLTEQHAAALRELEKNQ